MGRRYSGRDWQRGNVKRRASWVIRDMQRRRDAYKRTKKAA